MRKLSPLRAHFSPQISRNRIENQTPENRKDFTGRAKSEILFSFVDILMGVFCLNSFN